jgi:tRNA threonylcarbamoyladenosine biosynthesis protein TsaB
MAKGHAERLMPMVGEVLASAGCTPRDCTRFITTVGPGSFTGIRVAIAAARGFAVATGRPAVGVSTLQALAHDLLASHATVLAVVDARHGHAYGSFFGREGPTQPAGYRSCAAWASQAAQQIAPLALVGTGLDAIIADWPDGATPPRHVEMRAFPAIATVIAIGMHADPARAPASPDYLKAVDARMMAVGKGG